MKKITLFFTLAMSVLLLTNANAQTYQNVEGNMAHRSGFDRKLNSFTITDGNESLAVSSIQGNYTAPVYVDKTTSELITEPGNTLRFSAFSWDGSWMHAYVYIDYNKDYSFNTVKNNDGSVKENEIYGELVSYNYYGDDSGKNGADITGTATSTTNEGAGALISGTYAGDSKAVPAFTLPEDLAPGKYRVRIKIDWNNLDGNTGTGSDLNNNNGCQCDFTIVIKDQYEPYATGDRQTGVQSGTTYYTRQITGITVNGASIENTTPEQLYVDLTSKTFTVVAGSDVNLEVNHNDISWMHSYVYIDFDGNGFEYQEAAAMPYGDLVSYSFKHTDETAQEDNTSDADWGHNSAGDIVYGANVINNIPSFTAPTTPGTYRMRYKMAWDDYENPNGNEKWVSDAGTIIDFTLVVIEEIEMTVGTAGWASLYLDYNATIPNDVEAYIVTGVKDGDWLNLVPVTGVLPANTGVLVNAATGEYPFTYSTETPAEVTGNLLEGVLVDTPMDEEYYVLANGAKGIGLYRVEEENVTDTKTAKANKAYLPASAVPAEQLNSNGFRFDFGDGTTTEIDEVKTENGNVKTVYDLQGRIVENPAAGIYIVNGKKVLVK